MKNVEGTLIRAKIKWSEMGEKNNKYFLNLEKRNYNSKYIKKLVCNNKSITNPELILNEEMRFYKNLYTSKIKTEQTNTQDFLVHTKVPKLDDVEKIMCDRPLQMIEIASALKELNNDKTPGNDGFTTNFYKFFWPDIRNILLDTYNFSFQTGILTNDQRRSILNLIPKQDKDLRFLKNWRPVSILNTDYKILTKALAKRLQSVLPKLISPDQVGYLKNRYIGENVRIIDDVMSYADLKNLEGYIILLDFEKAFDSIEWSYLFKTLKTFNFGENFQRWIKILYTDIESTVSNNRYSSKYFQLSRGIRQGCPISALLFLLVAETMACIIKKNKGIRGISIEKEIFKICQLADDTTIFVSDIESIENLMNLMNQFYEQTGLKINLDKSQVIPIGKSKVKVLKLPRSLKTMIVNTINFKTLGVWFSYDINESITLNFSNKIKKIESILNIWKCRKLSLKGRVLIIKSLILPQITYLLSVCYCPERILKQFETIILRFLWENKTPKIKKNAIIATYDKGGLKLPEIFAVNTAAKVKWIKKLLLPNKEKWKTLTWYLLNIPKHKICNKLPLSQRFKSLTPFHRQVFESWEQFYGVNPKTADQILQELIFDNKFICSNGEPLSLTKLGIRDKSLERLFIGDIVSYNGNILSYEDFCRKKGNMVNSLAYNILISSIPRKWKSILSTNKFRPVKNNEIPKIIVKGQLKDLTLLNNKVLYWIAVNEKLREPTAKDKWIESYPFLEAAPWVNI